jgi:hypothetical protein
MSDDTPIDSAADDLIRYSFLSLFANDGTITGEELLFIKQMALRDCVIDDAEKKVLRSIFFRAERAGMSPEVAQEIAEFKLEYGIE